MCGRYLRKILREDIIKHFNIIDGLDYFDIHGYKMSAECFPGEPMFVLNSQNRPEDIWWTIEDKDNRGQWRRAINAKAETVTKDIEFHKSDCFEIRNIALTAEIWQEAAGLLRLLIMREGVENECGWL